MCGIAGLVGRQGSRGNWLRELRSMMNAIKHRGPDDQGFAGLDLSRAVAEEISDGNGGLYHGMMGFCRLSIRDLSRNGYQPMMSDEKNVVICFNGEIYNADHYREILKAKGYRFRGFSDTEVILNMYLEYGVEETAEKLNGMFGIAICDLRSRYIWLVRDRVGIKPLYYTVSNDRIAYASEVKAFLALDDFERRVNIRNLMEVMTFSRPGNSILLEGVEQVAPGHIVGFQMDNSNRVDITFFDLNDYQRPEVCSESVDYVAQKAGELLFACTDNQKVSDVKVGCQLSGGIDSSLITYAAAKFGSNRLRDTISIVFDEEKELFSEEPYIDMVTAGLNISAHKSVMTCDYFLDNFEKVIWHSDTVIGRPNSVGLYMISETARKHVTVLLSGEGADELLGGYDCFKRGAQLSGLLRTKKGADGIEFEATPRQGKQIFHDFPEFAILSGQTPPEELCRKVMPDYDASPLLEEKLAFFRTLNGSNFDRQIKYMLRVYLQELLVSQDKMSMANSIENRVPILDNDFIDFAFSVPESMLMREKNGELQGKYLLKHLSAELFGEDFAYRRKMGFPFPFFKYMKEDRFREYFYDLILPGTKKRGILDADALNTFYGDLHWSNPFTTRELFWKVCAFESWCQMFLDGREYQSVL